MLTGDLTYLHSVKFLQECRQSPSLGLLFQAHRHVRPTCLLTGFFGCHSALKILVFTLQDQTADSGVHSRTPGIDQGREGGQKAGSHGGNSTREVYIETESSRRLGRRWSLSELNRTGSGIKVTSWAAGDEHYQVCLMSQKTE